MISKVDNVQMTIFELKGIKNKPFKRVELLNENKKKFKEKYNMNRSVFVDIIEKKYREGESKKIKEALVFAEKIHKNQFRETGEPYISHPLAVASYVVDSGFNVNTVITALLHDVIEDGNVQTTELKERFGGEVTSNIVLLTKPKLSNGEWIFADNEEYYKCVNDYKKLEGEEKVRMYEERLNVYYPKIYESESFSPFFVKIFDNIHNVETSDVFHEKKQLRTLRITATHSLLHMTKLLGLNNKKLKELIEKLKEKIPDFNLEDYVGKFKHSKPVVRLPLRSNRSKKMFLEMTLPEMENISLYGDAKTAYLTGYIEVGFPKKEINYINLLVKKLKKFGLTENEIISVESDLPSEIGASEKMVKIILSEPKIEIRKKYVRVKGTNLKINKIENVEIIKGKENKEYKEIERKYEEIIKILREIYHNEIKKSKS